MSVKRIYSCNLCRDDLDRHAAIGILWSTVGAGWIVTKDPSENHLCARCISSIQKMEPVCGQGFNCNGGPKCGSDHK